MALSANLQVDRFLITLLVSGGLLGSSSMAQVSVSARSTKSEYLVGEPIVVLLEIRNVGDDLVAYGGGCDSDIKMSVATADPIPTPRYGCSAGIGAGGCGGVDHPPRLKIGESVSLRLLLKGYRLTPGSYVVKVSGKAPVYWKYYASEEQKHALSDPVPGREFSQTVPIRIRSGTDDELKQAYAPLIAAAKAPIPADRREAQEAIAEMAPEFLEDLIISFAEDQYGKQYSVIGLRHLNTTSSRTALMSLYDKSSDLVFRRGVVEALAELGSPEQLEFFASLLPGRETEADERVRTSALQGLGRVGGPKAVKMLVNFKTHDQRLEDDLIYALGNTKSKKAVPALIDRWTAQSENSICNALGELTHRSWCRGDGRNPVPHWKHWWQAHHLEVAIYGDDNCSGALNGPPIG